MPRGNRWRSVISAAQSASGEACGSWDGFRNSLSWTIWNNGTTGFGCSIPSGLSGRCRRRRSVRSIPPQNSMASCWRVEINCGCSPPMLEQEKQSPPRVRGTETIKHAIDIATRITPACAGNRNCWGTTAFPRHHTAYVMRMTVYRKTVEILICFYTVFEVRR